MSLPIPKMMSVWTLPSHSSSTQPPSSTSCFFKSVPPNAVLFNREIVFLPRTQIAAWNRRTTSPKLRLRVAATDDSTSTENEPPTKHVAVLSRNLVTRLHETVATFPPVAFVMKRCGGISFTAWLCIATVFVFVAVRVHVVRKSRNSRPGSVADLVRRGQLRSDRRGISKPLKYEDPFNNPLVKVGKSNSTVEMCGKVYRLAPVTLTNEEQAIHQKRRSRAYQWKRPTVFLKEGDSVPPDVDPETVRWIPANHPFATTASEIDEDLAQNNVYQQHGVPFRIQAEHEELQRKLEALQHEQKFKEMVIGTGNARDFERPFKFDQKSNEVAEKRPLDNQTGDSNPSKPDSASNSRQSSSSSQEM